MYFYYGTFVGNLDNKLNYVRFTGASTKEAQIRVGQEIAEQLVNLVKPATYNTVLAEVTSIFRK